MESNSTPALKSRVEGSVDLDEITDPPPPLYGVRRFSSAPHASTDTKDERLPLSFRTQPVTTARASSTSSLPPTTTETRIAASHEQRTATALQPHPPQRSEEEELYLSTNRFGPAGYSPSFSTAAQPLPMPLPPAPSSRTSSRAHFLPHSASSSSPASASSFSSSFTSSSSPPHLSSSSSSSSSFSFSAGPPPLRGAFAAHGHIAASGGVHPEDRPYDPTLLYDAPTYSPPVRRPPMDSSYYGAPVGTGAAPSFHYSSGEAYPSPPRGMYAPPTPSSTREGITGGYSYEERGSHTAAMIEDLKRQIAYYKEQCEKEKKQIIQMQTDLQNLKAKHDQQIFDSESQHVYQLRVLDAQFRREKKEAEIKLRADLQRRQPVHPAAAALCPKCKVSEPATPLPSPLPSSGAAGGGGRPVLSTALVPYSPTGRSAAEKRKEATAPGKKATLPHRPPTPALRPRSPGPPSPPPSKTRRTHNE